MKTLREHKPPRFSTGPAAERGFGLAEFLIASLMLLVISAALFSLLAECQGAAGYQTEVQAVIDNTRLAMDMVDRYLCQAGNDPRHIGIVGITIVSPTEVRVISDLTGSLGPGYPDKGDPDGDVLDSGEDVTIRYNAAERSIEIVPAGGSAQAVAGYISAFSMQFYDAIDAPTTKGNDVRKVSVTISGASTVPDPKTRRPFGITLTSEVQVATQPS